MTQREVPFGRPYIDDAERSAVMDVLNGHILTHGPKCTEFEQAFAEMMQSGYALTTSSCMASLHLASIYFGVGPGDEVLVPAQTHVATVHAVELMGARPVFIDCELATGNIDINKLEAAITPKTKAISLVHFAGIPVAMDGVLDIAKKHKLTVIEDCALAVGGRYKGKHVGLWGDVGCFSFYPVKHIATGEGGMLVSKNEDTVKKIGEFRAFNVDRTHTQRKIPGVYNVKGVGMNYRMSEMQAAIGVEQMKKVPEILAKRKENFETLKAGLLNVDDFKVLDAASPDVENSYYCLTAILPERLADQRTEIIQSLNAAGVGTSIYYPQPVNRMDYYQNKYGYDAAKYANAAKISDESIALPVGPHLNTDDMNYIADTFKQVLMKKVA